MSSNSCKSVGIIGAGIQGVCIGLQIMAKTSSEGSSSGLGWIDGEVKIIDHEKNIILPHMGWNEIQIIEKDSKLLSNLQSKRFYFLHSYHFIPNQEKNKKTRLQKRRKNVTKRIRYNKKKQTNMQNYIKYQQTLRTT